MKTIKLIDLLVKIANDELEDIKFKCDGFYFKYSKHSRQIDRYEDEYFDKVVQYNDIICDCRGLKAKIEIIEDKPKKIEKMGQLTPQQEIYKIVRNIYNKLDELIEQVNYLLEKSN